MRAGCAASDLLKQIHHLARIKRDFKQTHAALLLRALADYDLFQFQNRIKPDYANAQGLEVYKGGEWCEWESPDGDEIGDVADALLATPAEKPKRIRGRRVVTD